MTLSKLESLLLFSVLETAPSDNRWASECRAALYAGDRLRDKEFRRTCLGAVFRRAAKADPGWFLAIIRRLPDDVLALAPYITPERPKPIALDLATLGLAATGRHVLGPGRRGWDAWVEDCVEAESVATAATALSDVERYGLAVKEPVLAVAVPAPSAPPAAETQTIIIQPKAAKKKARAVAAAAQGGLF